MCTCAAVQIVTYASTPLVLSSKDACARRCGFWRIMLDEAQLVANTSSIAAQVASSLWRRHAWVVTGVHACACVFTHACVFAFAGSHNVSIPVCLC